MSVRKVFDVNMWSNGVKRMQDEEERQVEYAVIPLIF